MKPSCRPGILWRLRRGRTNRGGLVTWVLVIAVAAALSVVACRVLINEVCAIMRTVVMISRHPSPFCAYDGESSRLPCGPRPVVRRPPDRVKAGPRAC